MPARVAPSTQLNITAQIERFNAGRDPERLALKYKALRSNAYSFLRGTCHLFWAEVPASFWHSAVPLAWTCGDLHLENFGCYKGDDRQVYFDMNDFDEALLAPCIADTTRLLTSIMVAAKGMQVDRPGAETLCHGFINAYSSALQGSKAHSIAHATADGLIRTLMDAATRRKRVELLDSRTDIRNRIRKIRIDGKRALPANKAQRAQVERFMASFAARQDNPKFFRLLDVARRIAGTGSLGIERYVLLIEGRGSPDGNYLLDLKEARPSVLAPYVNARQPDWESEADRVVSIQRRMQAVSQAFLHSEQMDGKPFVLRGLQPSEDRLNLADAKGRKAKLQPVVAAMGKILAWDQLRASGRQGSAIADDLIAFGRDAQRWESALIELATNLAKQVETDWRAFRDNPRRSRTPSRRLTDTQH
jgi:uncharacterized protein (DUF2252 family)